MRTKLSPLVVAPLLLGIFGCGSSEPSTSTDAEIKAFKGGPMPKDFAAKNGMTGGGPAATGQAQGEELARKAAAEAAAKNGK